MKPRNISFKTIAVPIKNTLTQLQMKNSAYENLNLRAQITTTKPNCQHLQTDT